MKSKLTTNESIVLQFFVNKMKNWRLTEPGYSDVSGNDASRHFKGKFTPKQISGICSSLFKKEYLFDGYDDDVTISINWDKIPTNNNII